MISLKKGLTTMILITGGAYQGKLDYVFSTYSLQNDAVIHCQEHDCSIPCGKPVVNNLDLWILALIRSEKNVESAVNDFIASLSPESVIICNDISSGIVPIDAVLRQWREEVGRTLAALARQADTVVRLFCGIPTVLKG